MPKLSKVNETFWVIMTFTTDYFLDVLSTEGTKQNSKCFKTLVETSNSYVRFTYVPVS